MSTSQFFPTARGWVALLLPLLGGLLFSAVLPARLIESGVGTWLVKPVSPSAWSLGGLLILVCVAACVEAFRRGSRTDRIVGVLAAVLTFLFMYGFLSLVVLRVRPQPNQTVEATATHSRDLMARPGVPRGVQGHRASPWR